MTIKVCGLRDADNVRAVAALPIDLTGFIFYEKSPRYVAEKPAYLPERQKKVGVFVNSPIQEIVNKVEEFGLDYVQLHGNETIQDCESLKEKGIKLIKAIGIKTAEDFTKADIYEPYCEMFVFDTKCDCFGGSGKSFDHGLLKAYKGNKPFLLSGGIKPDNTEALMQINHPKLAGFDLNSGFETAPAIKDVKLLEQFLEKIGKTKINI